jgi:flagellar motor switch protein FliM
MPVKRLSAEAIMGRGDKLPNNLAEVTKGFNRFAQVLSTKLREMTSQIPIFVFESCSKAATRPIVSDEGVYPGLSEQLYCPQIKQCVRVTANRAMIYAICDLAFGGSGSEKLHDVTRPFSKIEQALTSHFFKIIGTTLPAAMAPAPIAAFVPHVPLESHEGEALKPFKPLVSVKILCNMQALSGEIVIDLPTEVIACFEVTTIQTGQTNMGKPSEWSGQISDRLEMIEVDLVAILADLSMSVRAIADFSVGQTIGLGVDIESPLAIFCGATKLFSARLGQKQRKYCLVVHRTYKGEPPLAVSGDNR